MRLYTQAQNSAGERVRIALHLKGVTYDYVPVSMLDDGAYRLINPQQLMPALQVDGAVLTQSLAIIDYLEETFPTPSLLPDNPIATAQARAFAMAISAELHALTVKRVRKRLPPETVADWYQHWTAQTLGALEQMLVDRVVSHQFCFADYPTLADIALVPQLGNARRFACDLSPYPRLLEVDAHCQALQTFQAARPERQVDYVPEVVESSDPSVI